MKMLGADFWGGLVSFLIKGGCQLAPTSPSRFMWGGLQQPVSPCPTSPSLFLVNVLLHIH